MMDIISVNKKQTNGSIKRLHSITPQHVSKQARKQIDFENNSIDVYDYFLHERPFANVKIIINEQTIWCDKALLSAASPVLREQLLRNMTDDSLLFHDVDLDEFLVMLKFIYPIFNPEISERNISSLIELSYRFRYDVLQQACQIYVIKYLNTIRCILGNIQNSEEETDGFVSNNHRKAEYHKQRDLIEFHNRTCIDGLCVIVELCRWLKTYFYYDNVLPAQAIISVLQQISVDYLEQALTTVDVNDEIKAYIYKERAQYLEQIHHVKQHII